MTLTKQILLAMVAAILLGGLAQQLLAMPNLYEPLRYILDDVLLSGVVALAGKIFVASLKLLVVPLVFVSLVCGVCHLRDQSTLGWLSLKTILLYLVTTAIAITIALTMATLIGPGQGIDLVTETRFSAPAAIPLLDVLVNIFPTNPFKAMVEGNMLQVIVFALLIGLALGRSGVAGERIGHQFNDWNEVLMTLISLLMKFAPYGVFSVLFVLFAKQGLGTISDLAVYMLTVIAVLLIHGLIVYPLILRVFTGLSPFIFLAKMSHVQLFAFSTASSNATLPITMKAVEEDLGVQKRVASFALPMGATINMDGTAIMQGVATVFISQAFGLELTMGNFVMVIVTATLASIGTAGVPGVGLVTLALVLQQVGLPVEGIALIIGVDRLLDMIRTAVNVTGDAMVSVVVAHSEGALDEACYYDRQASS
jgi:Na+/H+-dicarboxylate symporter